MKPKLSNLDTHDIYRALFDPVLEACAFRGRLLIEKAVQEARNKAFDDAANELDKLQGYMLFSDESGDVAMSGGGMIIRPSAQEAIRKLKTTESHHQ